jgi:7-cyano-7-deazaguanine reductase
VRILTRFILLASRSLLAPEFTALWAVTGQPDFAHVAIDYVPEAWFVESKALKFYFASFRNHSTFHVECTITIDKRLAATLEPAYLRISGHWNPRVGIPIDVCWEFDVLPENISLADQGAASYRGGG